MGLRLGDEFPDFSAAAYPDNIESFHKFIGNNWVILFSHPADYTPVCTTELARVHQLADEFAKRKVRLVALSCDDVNSHAGWSADILHYAGSKNGHKNDSSLAFSIIADSKRELAEKLGMIDPDEKDSHGIPLTARAVFVVGPDKKLKLSILYPATVGRNFDEILRIVDALQLTASKPVATPVDWQPGKPCMVIPTLSADEAAKIFEKIKIHELPSGKHYLRETVLVDEK
uniref:Thioredoxin domain-containing protein n=1 Tax=Panagrolaimus sp. ES5 TaxID=591445 RepID=A0AC34GZ53_9BILA